VIDIPGARRINIWKLSFTRRWGALRKRPILFLFLRKAWVAYLSLVAYGLFATYLFPKIARPFYKMMHANKHAWWVKAVSVGDAPPAWKGFLESSAPFVWLVGISLFAALIEWRLSRTLTEAAANAEKLAEKATKDNPSGLARLYRAAAEWSFDEEHEETLLEYARQADDTVIK
jgi:hypothetical protein